MRVSLFFVFFALASAGVGVPKVNSFAVLSATSFSIDISGSTKGSGTVYQAVSVSRGGVTVYGQSPALSFSTSRTSVTFTSAYLSPQDVIYHTYYDGADITTATVITSAAAVYQGVCLTTPSALCWTGSDYCTYPFDLGGVGGTTASTYANVASYVAANVGASYIINPASGCWSSPTLVPGTSATPLTDIHVAFASTYMIFTSGTNTGLVTSIPFQPYVQTTYQAHAVDIDWGDGTVQRNLVSSVGVTRTHTYATNATHTIRIAGTAHCLCYTALTGGDLGRLVDIQQWGNVVTYQMNFYDELRLGSVVVSATDGPNPSLVNIDRLFAVSLPFYTLAPYATRVTTFAGWSLPNVVTANDAFAGLNMTTGAFLPATLTSANNMYFRAILPSGLVLNGNTLTSSTSMFYSASLTGTLNITGVTFSASTSMFQGSTITGALTITSTTFVSPFALFAISPQSTYTTIVSTVTFTNSSISGDCTKLCLSTKFQTLTPISFDGLDFTGCTTAELLFTGANFAATPIMDTLSLPNAVSVGSNAGNGAFAQVNKLGALPALDLRSATTCYSAFSYATFGARFAPNYPLMKCVTATNMFKGTVFLLGADMSGMNVSQVVTATSFCESIAVESDYTSPATFSSCTNAWGLYAGASCRTSPCTAFNMSLLSLPVATDVFGLLAMSGTTTLSTINNLDLSAAVTCTSMIRFTVLSRFVPVLPNMKCTTSTFMFSGMTFPLGADFSGMNVSRVVTAPGMLQQTNFQGTTATVLPGPFTSIIDFSSGLLSSAFTVTPDSSLLAAPSCVNCSALFWRSKVDPDLSTWTVSAITNANNFIYEAYISTPARYSAILIAFSTGSTLNGATLGSPFNTTTGTTLQGYDASGSTAHADLTSRSWTLVDGGLM